MLHCEHLGGALTADKTSRQACRESSCERHPGCRMSAGRRPYLLAAHDTDGPGHLKICDLWHKHDYQAHLVTCTRQAAGATNLDSLAAFLAFQLPPNVRSIQVKRFTIPPSTSPPTHPSSIRDTTPIHNSPGLSSASRQRTAITTITPASTGISDRGGSSTTGQHEEQYELADYSQVSARHERAETAARSAAKRAEKRRWLDDQDEMKFSHSIQFNAVPDWSSHYIAYSNLKKLCATPIFHAREARQQMMAC